MKVALRRSAEPASSPSVLAALARAIVSDLEMPLAVVHAACGAARASAASSRGIEGLLEGIETAVRTVKADAAEVLRLAGGDR
ncbi:MAG TPA: hypothetical protein VNN10_09430 [Dehalococcoidia bacterium]|nr:hypothetical protein [Dehalococcoidia bacterium]